MTPSSCFRSWFNLGLGLLFLLTTGCVGSVSTWTVHTTSTGLPPTSSLLARLPQERVAVLTPLSVAGLRGNELALGLYLGEVIHKVAPHWTVVSEHDAMSLINTHGLAGLYAQMRSDAEMSHILDRDILKKVGHAVGARYVFQPRLAHFSQTMTDRWTIPAVDVLASQTRSANMRVTLKLWDTKSGELIWASMAESNLQSETVAQDPVYLEDISRVTFGSMLADLLNRKTSSTYTPLNHVLDLLIREEASKEANAQQSEPAADQEAPEKQGK